MEPEQNNMNVGEGENNNGGSTGLIIGAIVIIAIIILGGLYFWGQRADDSDAVTDTINTPNTSDEAAAIEADLNVTDIENLDAELNAS